MIAQWMKHLARALLLLVFCVSSYAAQDPLPSWNDGPAKQSIIDYVTRVTKEGGADYVAPKDRLATFDKMERCGSSSRYTPSSPLPLTR